MNTIASPRALSGRLLLVVSVLACVFTGPLEAGTPDVLDRARSVAIGPEAFAAFFPAGRRAADVKHERVDATGLEPAGKALRVTATEEKMPWDMGLSTFTTEAVAEGDVMLASFQMRNVKSMTGQALVMFGFQKADPEWDKSLWKQVSVGSEWTQVSLPFTMKAGYPAGKAAATFSLAMDDQTLEIANLRVLNFGPDFDIDTLPTTDVAYEGRAADAPWRTVAAERIEQHRKGDLTVTVRDGRGQPVPGASVEIAMTRHAFEFGTAVSVHKTLLRGSDGDRYRQELLNNFNAGGFESALKWNNYGSGRPDEIERALNWLVEHGISVRGNVIMWPSWRWIHPDVIPLRADPPKLRQAVEDHVTDTVTRHRGRIGEWDVVNEPYTNHDLMDLFGDEVMADWYKLAHRADPDAVLYINDNELVSSNGRVTKHLLKLKEQIRGLLDQGAPLHGIGMQGHFASSLTAPEEVWRSIDHFAEFDLPVKISEFDINVDDPQLQADYLRDFYTAAFAHESISSIQTWGFWEGQHWRPNAAMFAKDWTLRPHGKAYRDLIYGAWWTHEHVTTDATGTATARGFLGDHRITVTGPDGRTQTVSATLGKAGQAVEVTLSDAD